MTPLFQIYSHQTANRTLNRAGAEFRAAGIAVELSDHCLCQAPDGALSPHVIVTPDYQDPACWNGLKWAAERNPSSNVYVAVFSVMGNSIVASMRDRIGKSPNVTYFIDFEVTQKLLDLQQELST